jgi:hypothetical protein
VRLLHGLTKIHARHLMIRISCRGRVWQKLSSEDVRIAGRCGVNAI